MSLFSCLLGTHIACGTTALLSGPVPMLSRKGGWTHRRAGDVYAVAMMLAAVAGFALALIKWNVLLLGIAIFTFFLVFCGVRAVGFLRGARPVPLDDVVCGLTMAFCTWLLWSGSATGDITSLFFGLAGGAVAVRHCRLLHLPTTDWLVAHLIAMGAAYIATVSAFLVVNVTFLPPPVVFIGPTLVGTPLTVWIAIRYRRQSAKPSLSMTRISAVR